MNLWMLNPNGLLGEMVTKSGNETADWLMDRIIDPERAPLEGKQQYGSPRSGEYLPGRVFLSGITACWRSLILLPTLE